MIDATDIAQSISLLGFLLYTWNLERIRANDANDKLIKTLELFIPKEDQKYSTILPDK